MFAIHFILFPIATVETPQQNSFWWLNSCFKLISASNAEFQRRFQICCPASGVCSFSVWSDLNFPASIGPLKITDDFPLEKGFNATLMGPNWHCKHFQTYRSSNRPCIINIHLSWLNKQSNLPAFVVLLDHFQFWIPFRTEWPSVWRLQSCVEKNTELWSIKWRKRFNREFVVWHFDVLFNGNHVFSGHNSAVKLTGEMTALAGQNCFHCK